ncbi:MAG: S49 family peptidase [Alphaproteobacteria bacterium]
MRFLFHALNRLLPRALRSNRTVVPIVRLSGAIGGGRLNSGMTLASVETTLRKAFAIAGAPVVAISINSPGGSAVQSHLIYKRIKDLSAENEKKVIVGVEDVAASGGYVIALAGDEILADPNSIVGSIGVIAAGFGFAGLLEKIGVERRVHASGEHKGMLDPFRPEKEEDIERLHALHGDIFAWFVDLVKTRRAEKLGDDPDLFTGAFWSGRRALELGLVDGLGDLRAVLRERYGAKVRLRMMTTERSRLARRFGLGAPAPAPGLTDALVGALEERLLWARYGL